MARKEYSAAAQQLESREGKQGKKPELRKRPPHLVCCMQRLASKNYVPKQ